MTIGVQSDDSVSLSLHIKQIAQDISNSEKYKKLVSGELFPGYVIKVKLAVSIEEPPEDDLKFTGTINVTNSQEIDNQVKYTQPTDMSSLLKDLDRLEANDPGIFPVEEEY